MPRKINPLPFEESNMQPAESWSLPDWLVGSQPGMLDRRNNPPPATYNVPDAIAALGLDKPQEQFTSYGNPSQIEIPQRAPASETAPLNPASGAAPLNPALKQALLKKITPLQTTPGQNVSDEQKAQAEYEAGKVNPWLAFVSGVGQSLQGKSPDLSWQDAQNKLVYDKTLGKLILDKKAAEDKRRFDEQMSFQNKRLAVEDAQRRDIAALAKSQQKAGAQQKTQQTMNEIEDRRQNINANLDSLRNMIQENGTFELFGSQNQDMDRLLDQVATDMAKLQDPNSVARPSEVEAVKRTLIKPGFANSNKTALDILNNFGNEVNRRANSAYKIRGLQAPEGRPEAQNVGQAPAKSRPKQVIQNGHTYILNEQTGEYE